MSAARRKNPGRPAAAAAPLRPEVLLTDPSPCLRTLVLQDLLGRPAGDPEVRELASLRSADPLLTRILARQEDDGSFSTPGESRYGEGRLAATALALSRLGFLGFGTSFPPAARAAEWLFSRQRRDGSWPIGDAGDEEGQTYSMIPLQTAIPLTGLARAGYAEDPRAERGFRWLLDQRLPDGAWPTGLASGVHGYVAGYRRLPHSRWGCRTNTTESLICLSLHPRLRHGEEARRALGHLLARETRERSTLGYEAARSAGMEEERGYFTRHAAFDPGLVLELCAAIGASTDDERASALREFVLGARSEYGLWEYTGDARASAWVSFTLQRALARLAERGAGSPGDLPAEPRTPGSAYPKRKRRY